MEHLDYLYSLSLSVVERSKLDGKRKRDLDFGLYCFRCLFDSDELVSPSRELVTRKCCFFIKEENYPLAGREELKTLKNGEAAKNGGIVVEKGGERMIKFDVGSDVWKALVGNGELTGEAATLPDKPSLYSLVNEITALDTATDELKAAWYIMFPMVIFLDAPYEPDVYEELKTRLATAKIFDAALKSQRSIMVYDTEEEMRAEGISPLAVDWYLPYIEYKNERTENGDTREVARFKRELALKNYAFVVAGTEKLLNAFPFDEELTLVNIAARVSAFDMTEGREQFLRETLIRIGEALAFCKNRYIYLLYYAGMCKLGLREFADAEADFKACLELDPDFELAAFMLKALREPEKWTKK